MLMFIDMVACRHGVFMVTGVVSSFGIPSGMPFDDGSHDQPFLMT